MLGIHVYPADRLQFCGVICQHVPMPTYVSLSGAAVRSTREKKLIEATIKAVMQVIPSDANFSIRKVLQDMDHECTSAEGDEEDIQKSISTLTDAIYRDIASK